MTHLIVQNTKNGSDFLRICIDCRDFYNVLSTCSRAEGSWFENNILNLGISSLKFECVLFAWNVRINSAGTQRVRTGTGIYAKWSKTDAKEVYFATLKRLILQLEAYSFTVLGHFAKNFFPNHDRPSKQIEILVSDKNKVVPLRSQLQRYSFLSGIPG